MTNKFWDIIKKIIPIILGVAILILIYTRIDFVGLIKILKGVNIRWFIISIIITFPILILTSLRFQQLIVSEAKLGFINSLGLILTGNSLNILLPSKMGDIAKAFFLKKTKKVNGTTALSLVIIEKSCDMLSLLSFCLIGLIVYPIRNKIFFTLGALIVISIVIGILFLVSRKFSKIFFIIIVKIAPKKMTINVNKMYKSWQISQGFFLSDKIKLSKIVIGSLFIWFLHLLQIWFFVISLRAWVPFLYNLAIAPLSILVGLLPLTFAGIGTRDGAIIILYGPYLDPSTGAALGLLYTLRYLIPAFIGIPFVTRYSK